LDDKRSKVVLLSRSMLGVDKLTEESQKLFSGIKDFDRLIKIQIFDLEAVNSKKDT
jgi:hypothetical protein